MLFHVDWEFVDTSEAGEKRSLEVFSKWQPPEGAHFQAFYGYADGTGGFAIVEAENAAALARASGAFTPWVPSATMSASTSARSFTGSSSRKSRGGQRPAAVS